MISEERLAAAANAIGEIKLFADKTDLIGYAFYEALARAALEASDQVALSEERVEDGAIALNAEISAIPWAQQTPPIQEYYRRQARAVLQADDEAK